VLALADVCIPDGATFRISVKRVGDHSFTSQQLAASLGAEICARAPSRRVDLAAPDVAIGVEVRGRDCYLFDEVIVGADRRESAGPRRAGRPTFLVDHMLGKLKVALRLLGYDTAYVRHEPDSAVIRRARAEGRIVLTRDRELSRVPIIRAVYIIGRDASEQVVEVVRALALRPSREQMFTRCSLCNRRVEPVAKTAVRERVPREVYVTYDEFTRCIGCDKLYWKGGQYDRLLGALAPALAG
jgi:uncharacterized protein with PIN domain